MSQAQIAALLAIWTAVAVVAEVPSGAVADRWSRRGCLVVGGVLQAVAYACWLTAPTFAGFAVGFVVWGVGGSLYSGAFEALLYDGLHSAGAADRYAAVKGRADAAAHVAQLPVAVLATVLFDSGGFALVGWVSVGGCLAAAVLAAALPELPPSDAVEPEIDGAPAAAGRGSADEVDELGYLDTLRTGVHTAVASRGVRTAVIALAVLFGLDAFEEFTPLLAVDWGVATAAVPLALLGMPVAGAIGSALAARARRLPGVALAVLLAGGAGLLVVSGLSASPASLVGVTVFYGIQQLLIVVADARLQAQIAGPVRATVTSVATLGAELSALVCIGLWAVGGLRAFVALVAVVALALAWWLGRDDAAPPGAAVHAVPRC